MSVSHTHSSSPPFFFFFFFFLRCYNFREVLAFSTNSFHLGRFLMQSFQFVIFIFVISLFTSSYHLFSSLPSDLVNAVHTHKLFLPCCCLLHYPTNHNGTKNIKLQNYITVRLNKLLRQYTIPFCIIYSME